jgi:DNA (cytosine-5)-methyltransferase 1
MKFGSVCSGIEAASVAWGPLGWKAAWLSEIEPFPSAVLAHHYPDVPNLGDMTLLPERILSGEVEAPDVFCGGTPCQAFSVAGLRNSLDDARGNLSLVFCEIANAIDKVRSIRGLDQSIVFWENVPGVLSTKDNAFGCFLAGLAGEDNPLEPPRGKWTNAGYVLGPKRAVAWRLLDAQYFGVAQRRKRVFVVASARDDFDPAAVLFEFDGVRRDTAPSREAGQKPSPCVTNGPPFSRTGNERVEAEAMVVQPYDVGNCLTARMHKGINSTLDEGQTPVLQPAQPIDFRNLRFHEGDVAGTMQSKSSGGYSLNYETGVMQPIGLDEEQNAMIDAFGTLKARTAGGGFEGSVMQTNMAVRRLTPVECERLQGFPDGYTNIPWRKKDESPDGPRYKALGNSWAVPVVRWIGERIAKAA